MRDVLFDLGAPVLISAPFIGAGGGPATRSHFGAISPSNCQAAPRCFCTTVKPTRWFRRRTSSFYAAAIPGAHVRRLPGRDHQLNNDLAEVARDIRELTLRSAV
jgi:hypothetical protein